MNLKTIIQWSLKHWWWFIISVFVCLLLGGVRFITATPKYNVRAALMLRHASESVNSDAMLQMMGLSANKVTGDEVKVLSSRDLIGRVVDELDLTTTYIKKNKGKWEEQYPDHELIVNMNFSKPQNVVVDVVVHKNVYCVKVKRYMKKTERFKVCDLSQPISTSFGELTMFLPDTIHKGHYRASIMPRVNTIDWLVHQLTINRLSRESNVITLSTQTRTPLSMVATINTMLNLYNQESTTDKNRLAVKTEQFLVDRIAVVEHELNEVEAEVESYKRTQHIADLNKTAENYQELGEKYEQRVAEIDADLHVIDYILEQLDSPENAYAMIPGSLASDNKLLNELIQDYNEHIARRNGMLQTATELNPVVIKETELLNLKRHSVQEGVLQEKQTLLLKRQAVLNQQNQYMGRLASLPETERRYVEICREKETKEKQYLYLIEKREENAMLLSSESVPARIIESAQIEPTPASPKLKMMVLVALFFGLLLPLLVYFFNLFRKEYL